MTALQALALLALLQEAQTSVPQDSEKHSLVWSFKVGQSKEVSWKGRTQVEGSGAAEHMSGTDISMHLKGTLEILTEEADGSLTGNLSLHYQLLQGRFQGSAMDVLVEDGKLKKPVGPIPEGAQKRVDAIMAPAKIRVTKRGTLEFLAPHPLSTFAGICPPLGPILPAKKRIAIGDSWLVPLQLAGMKAMDFPAINVEYSFKELVDASNRKCAHIVLHSKQMVRLGNTDVSCDILDDAFFDIVQGECVRDHNAGSITMTAPGWKLVTEYDWEFETLPPQKR